MQLSVIIVNYQVRYFLELCLHSVQEAMQNIDGEIIVIDNHSTDNSCSMVKELFPQVILIENKKNVGFSKANNQGVQMAKGEYILILNPDTVVAEDTFIKILDFAKQQNDLGALGVKLIDGTGRFLPESKRNLPTPGIAFQKILGFKKTPAKGYYATQLEENTGGTVEVLAGAFMLIKRRIYLEVHGFDEDYFMFGEDIDLSYKLTKKGYNNYYYPATQIIHYKGESTVKDARYLMNFYGAMRIFYNKHFTHNRLTNIAMNISIRFWKTLKIWQLKKPVKITSEPPNQLLYLGDNSLVYEALKNHYSHSSIHVFTVCSTRVISRYDDLEKINNMIAEKQLDEIIFDQEATSFSKIIFYIQALQDKGLTFKIKPKNASFIIGSNDKEQLGEVVLLEDV